MRLAIAATATLLLSSAAPADDAQWATAARPDPRVGYGTFAVACDSVRALTRAALGAWADSARWSLRREPFTYRDRPKLSRSTRGDRFWTLEDRDSTVLCLRLELENHVQGAPGSAALGKALERAGWVMDDQYDADGPDGTVFALVCREALCLIEGQWDGGDDSDSTYVSAPGETVLLRCVPRPAHDPRPKP